MIDFAKFAAYSKPGPRYTSYPTAVEFHSDFDAKQYRENLQASDKQYAHIPLSVYVHLPFCRSACYFCGCNVVYTSKEEKKARYIGYFKKELALLAQNMNTTREVVQLHFGGGTPTFFNAHELQEIIESLRATFPNFAPNAEISCEVDPRYFTQEQMQVLHDGGFNRLSFGVQDFHPKVQEAVHRHQSPELVREAVELARKFGIDSINFDLIYGLPFQNLSTFKQTLDSVLELSPERLAIFNYAHVPWIKKTMRKIDESTLPPPQEKLKILQESIKVLGAAGYEMIGMDHFAKKSDELYRAKQQRQLRRNFQGYTTRGFSQTIGIGLTSISEGVEYYAQNYKDMAAYEAALNRGVLPTERGIKLTREDRLRKSVIMELMNNLSLEFSHTQREFGIDFRSYFARELALLAPYEEAGLLEIRQDSITTTQTGAMLIRNIAMCFDAYLHNASEQKRFSKTI